MRTTIRLPDGLYQHVRQRAAAERRTVTSFIEESLRRTLAERTSSAESPRFTLDPFAGTGTLPGVDLTDSAALLGHMEH